ncbi:beta-ketoacyl synthase N-terminal-like domain-containing protein [Streptomyces sp. H10-C2]|uniref:type I polyketide synthase n=1 Tax=unclassified Streptomyces TaxID=2593676 RepID=UPI0024B8DD05|nr:MULTISPECIES: beta-ketoacyl synthase N-terminal-like domain-containing protein [unclassified Streptomyces]MDJ0341808.1 beta-ketoacyl synthase N-terminal-like domain-containing protein [Streptomyces sp. PH10-H1]MDJ0370438.1 beta-ketoacyl synthase N-terminal-like domain-containing protein [Streptomyces sp. H10-C2]
MNPIAVLGLDCRFPGAPDPGAYWDLLAAGADGVGPRPASRRVGDTRRASGPAARPDGGFIDDADAFDHAFFGIGRAEAAAMDPQQRLLLQTAWRALEDSGINPRDLAGSGTGIYVGAMADDWSRLRLADDAAITPRTGTGAGRAILANRLSYQLDLRGPSLTVDSACSSALIAVHLAAGALLSGECDIALACGVNLVMSDVLDEIYGQSGLAAPDGRCKPFGAQADGIGRAEGVGAVVLQRLDGARAAGRPVRALLLGSAVNQDGRSNGIMAPSRRAQREVIQAACRRAGVDPQRIGWVEAHGTGTPVGDLIEARALGDVYGGLRPEPCAISSVKGNIGHAEGAAGIAGLIKAVLALEHRLVPPVRTAGGEHPGLELSAHGLRLLTDPLPLPDGEMLAAVSSFGMGGSNAHVVLATAPRPPAPAPQGEYGEAPGVFTLTAPTAEALRRNLAVQAGSLAARTQEPVTPLCWTSNLTRTGMAYRIAIPAEDTAGLAAALDAAAEAGEGVAEPPEPPVVAFLFTGQGAQYPGMTTRLYRESPLYRRHLDDASRALEPHLGGSVTELLLSRDERVHRTGWTQPAVFAVQYALAGYLEELGVRPGAVLGHSIGEFAAAVTAGALGLEDAAALVAVRGTSMEALPEGGGMLAVRAHPDDLREVLAGETLVGLGAANGAAASVLSGDLEALARIREQLAARGVGCTPLKVSHAFHSVLMDPVVPGFRATADRITAGEPRLPFFSTVRGGLLAGRPLDADYWCEHITGTVRFADAAAALLGSGVTHLVELGPKPVLLPLARRLPGGSGLPGISVVRDAHSGALTAVEAAAALYTAGVDIDWARLYRPEDQRYARLAPQSFDTTARFWHEPPRPPAAPAGEPGSPVLSLVRAGSGPRPPERDGGGLAEAVRETIAGIIGADEGALRDDDRFYDDLGFDSVMFMELKYRLEEAVPALGELSIPEMMSSLVSLATLTGYLREQLARVPA